MSVRMLGSAALAVALTAACGSERGSPRPGAPEPPADAPPVEPIRFIASDYNFSGPEEVPAGPANFTLENRGKEPHHLVVIRLEGGRTFDSLVAALKNPGPPPAWMHPIGGPNGVSGGGSSNAQLVLEPGPHAVICFVPTAKGVPHFANGMVRPLQVSAAPDGGAAARPAAADVVVKLSDYAFGLSAPLESGPQVVRVENAGRQLHEVVLARLAPGKSAEELAAWELGGRKGEPPGTYLGGAAPLAPGDWNQFNATPEPGEYAFICFVPDSKDGKPHTAHGMVKQFKVG